MLEIHKKTAEIKAATLAFIKGEVKKHFGDDGTVGAVTIEIVVRPSLKHPRAKLNELFSVKNIDIDDNQAVRQQVTRMRGALKNYINDTDKWKVIFPKGNWETMTAAYFLKHASFTTLSREPNCGHKGIELLRITLENTGFNADVLKNPRD